MTTLIDNEMIFTLIKLINITFWCAKDFCYLLRGDFSAMIPRC